MTDGLPARIDRAALERIIQRAAELQTADREIGEGLTTDQVMELGREVGIPGRYLQQALLEERTRIVQQGPEGLLGRTVGPAAMTAHRVVQRDRESIETILVEWMEKQELFSVQRHQPGRITWEPTGGFQAAYRRAVGGGWQLGVTAPWISIDGPGTVTRDLGRFGGGGASRSESGIGDIIVSATHALAASADGSAGLDFTGKVKLGTASRSKGLGTGEEDLHVELQAYGKTGDITPFATLGYKIHGDPPGINLRDVLYLEAGAWPIALP